jgi:hypothetical protein
MYRSSSWIGVAFGLRTTSSATVWCVSQPRTALRDKDSPRSARRPMQRRRRRPTGSRACACSMRHRPAYRLPCGPPWRALLRASVFVDVLIVHVHAGRIGVQTAALVPFEIGVMREVKFPHPANVFDCGVCERVLGEECVQLGDVAAELFGSWFVGRSARG